MIDPNSTPVLHILNGIFGDITDRKGIGDELYCCDKHIQHEIYEGWRKIIIEGLEMFAKENRNTIFNQKP